MTTSASKPMRLTGANEHGEVCLCAFACMMSSNCGIVLFLLLFIDPQANPRAFRVGTFRELNIGREAS
jgi:hypothetical protein